MKQHKVIQGECLSSIAAQYGFSVDAIWNLGDNSALKDKRKDPNTLVPGDVVAVPDRKEKIVDCETEKIHKFKLKAGTTLLRVQLFEDEKVFANEKYELKIGGETYQGTTDGDGVLETTIPAQAVFGSLTLGSEGTVFRLRLGYLQPVTEEEGVEARLRNLGFTEKKMKDALLAFQKRFSLEMTGEADQATQDKLVEIHDKVCAYPELPKESEDSAASA
jgi:N-acetylmuramoyl-L-alanine amidase